MATRRERIILEVEDRGSSKIAKLAAEAAALNRALESMRRNQQQTAQSADRSRASMQRQTNAFERSRTSLEGLNDELERNSRLGASSAASGRSAGNSARGMGREFDRASGRVKLLVDAALLLGPALIPVGAMAVPAISGLANQLGIAAAAAGVAVLAFQGVGDTVKAMGEYSVEPTADNLAKLHEEMSRLSPQARGFALQINAMRRDFAGLRDSAAAGLFPSLTRELDNIDPLLAKLEDLFFAVGQATGQELARGLGSLSSDRWTGFFDFLTVEAAPTMRQLSSAIGNSAHALSNMWQAFQPLNRDFGSWLVDVTDRWDRWSAGLDGSPAFEDFIAYIRTNGPEVAETLGAIGNMFLDIIVAAAPLGGPTLDVLEQIADIVGTIADSNIGTPILAGVVAMTLLRRATQATSAVMGSAFAGSVRQTAAGVRTMRGDFREATQFGAMNAAQLQRQREAAERLRGTLGRLAIGGAVLGGLAIAATGAADGIGLTNTTTLALMGTMGGPWGAAVGGAVGLMLDMNAAVEQASEAMVRYRSESEQALETNNLDALRASFEQFRDTAKEAADPGLIRRFVATLSDNAGLSALPGVDGMDDLANASDSAGAAVDRARAALKRTEDATRNLGAALELPTSNLADLDSVLEAAAPAMGDLGLTLDDLYAAALRDDLGGLTGGLGALGDTASTAGPSLEELTSAIADWGIETNRTESALEALTRAYENWSNTLSAFEAETAMAGALQELKNVADETGVSFDATTEAGQAFRDGLANWSSTTRDLVDNTPITERADVLEQAIVNLADTMGISIDEAWNWANQVGLSADAVSASASMVIVEAGNIYRAFTALPDQVQTEIRTNGFPRTAAQVAELQRRYNLTPDQVQTILRARDEASPVIAQVRSAIANVTRNVTVQVRGVLSGFGFSSSSAAGNLFGAGHPAVAAYAAGGIDAANAHRPEISRAGGPVRIWGEPETKGEAYIPLANDWRRARALDIWQQTGQILGALPEQYADGGLRHAQQSPAPRYALTAPAGGAELAAAATRAAQAALSALSGSAADRAAFLRAVEALPGAVGGAVLAAAEGRDTSVGIMRRGSGW